MKNEKYLSNLIGAFATVVSSDIEKQISELGGRSLNHEAALVAINNHPNETIDVLSKVLDLTHSGAVRVINTLEQEGLVLRQKSQRDARSVVLRTTQKGSDRVDKILSNREGSISKVFKHLNEEQKQHFTELLEVTMSHLTDKEIAARRICRMCDEGVCRKIGCPVEKAIK